VSVWPGHSCVPETGDRDGSRDLGGRDFSRTRGLLHRQEAQVDDYSRLRHNLIMMRNVLVFLPVYFFFPLTLLHTQTPSLGLRVPDGFEVTEFADNSLANDNGLAVFSRPRTNLAAEYS
jgi:hypothetical protein